MKNVSERGKNNSVGLPDLGTPYEACNTFAIIRLPGMFLEEHF
jgi:hypothetical protein